MSQTLGFQAAVEGLHLRNEGQVMFDAGLLIGTVETSATAHLGIAGIHRTILERTTDDLAIKYATVTGRELKSIFDEVFDALDKQFPASSFFYLATPSSLRARTDDNTQQYKFMQGWFAAKIIMASDEYTNDVITECWEQVVGR